VRALRVGLAGCGAMGRDVHLRLLRELPEFTIAAVADPDPAALAAAAAQAPGAAACSTHEELLARGDIEAVIVASPTASHAAVARAAFSAGLHVYLEKPLATTIEEGQGVLAAWRSAGTTGMQGFNYRFNPLYGAAKRQIESGALGSVAVVRTAFATPACADGGWRRPTLPGGGVLLDLGSHHFDLLHWLFGRRVVEVGRQVKSAEGPESMCVGGRLDGGIVFQCLFASGSIDEDRIDIYGDRGALSIDRYRSLDVRPRLPGRLGRMHDLVGPRTLVARGRYLVDKLRSPRGEPSHADALRHFAGAVRGDHRATPDLGDGFLSLAAVAAASSPEANGRQVAVAGGSSMPRAEVQTQ
jgi:predicted dehydrogenase